MRISLSMPQLDLTEDFKPNLYPRKGPSLLEKLQPASTLIRKSDNLFHSFFKNKHYFYSLVGKEIVYCVRVKLIELKFKNTLKKYLCQTSIWRNKDFGQYSSIAKDIFWNYIFKEYKAILSDRVQTLDGKHFWLRRIKDALNKNCRVKIIYLNNLEVQKIFPVKNIQILDENMRDIWDFDDKFLDIRIYIEK